MISEYTRVYNDNEWDQLVWACAAVCPILLGWSWMGRTWFKKWWNTWSGLRWAGVSVSVFQKLWRTVEGSEVKWVVKFGISVDLVAWVGFEFSWVLC